MPHGWQGQDSNLQLPIFTWDQSVTDHLCDGCVTLLVISKTAGKMVEVWKWKHREVIYFRARANLFPLWVRKFLGFASLIRLQAAPQADRGVAVRRSRCGWCYQQPQVKCDRHFWKPGLIQLIRICFRFLCSAVISSCSIYYSTILNMKCKLL